LQLKYLRETPVPIELLQPAHKVARGALYAPPVTTTVVARKVAQLGPPRGAWSRRHLAKRDARETHGADLRQRRRYLNRKGRGLWRERCRRQYGGETLPSDTLQRFIVQRLAWI